MWNLTNRTPYAAGKSWVRDKDGNHLWLVAVKATFDILPDGRCGLADEQAPALLAAEFWGDPGASSVRFDADVVPPKPFTDVVVHGSAHAPGGRPSASVQVSLQVANVNKSLIVHGERTYGMSVVGEPTTTASRPFAVRPIRYEDAFGGADLSDPDPHRRVLDTRNPVGKGVARDRSTLWGKPAHSVEYANGDAARRGPAGFGPIADFWSPRRERAGTYDANWERTKKPLLPDDYDELTLQCAPDDQRPSQHLRGDEQVIVQNMTPDGVLSFQLPRVYPVFSTWFGSRSEEHRARLGTVCVLCDQRQVILVWQTSLRVTGRDVDYLDATVIAEKTFVR
jgi:hypothetical protein